MDPKHSRDAGTKSAGTERIAAFSDGVIAIIITIMVLELKLSEDAAKGEVWSGFLTPLAPKLAIYALSFVIVGALWINHHQLLAVVIRATPQLMWMNLLLLFFMSLIPLATGFLGEHPELARAVSFYALIMTLSSAVFGLLRYCLGRMPEHDARAHSVPPRHLDEELHRHAPLCGGGDRGTVFAGSGSCDPGLRPGDVQHPDAAGARPAELADEFRFDSYRLVASPRPSDLRR